MRFISFFAGIGGFDLGLERAGHECVGQVEIDPYAIRVLEQHWPDVPRFGDIRTLDPDTLPDAELWCGGFPCQPFSVAGKRKATDDERDLWPAWFRLISHRRPRWIFGENVPGLLHAEGGKAWGRIVRDLASVGYVGEWTVLGARNVGAPHRRDRLWVVACLTDADRGRREQCNTHIRGISVVDVGRYACWCGRGEPWCCDPADAPMEHAAGDGRGEGRAESVVRRRGDAATGASEATDAGRALHDTDCGRYGSQNETIPTGRDGLISASGRSAQPVVGRVAHGVPRRVDRLRCLGNAVVPQVVEAIARHVWGDGKE